MDTQTANRNLTWQEEITAEALTWEYTPFHHKARIKGVGVDCGGFLYQLFAPYIPGIKPFPRQYAPDWSLHRDDELYINFLKPYFNEHNEDLRLADILVLQIGRAYSHGLIYIGNKMFMHAYGMQDKGCVRKDREATVVRAYNQPIRFKRKFRLKE